MSQAETRKTSITAAAGAGAAPFLQLFVIYDIRMQRATAVVSASSPEEALASHEYATLTHHFSAANWVRVDPDVPTAQAVVYAVDGDSKFTPTMQNIHSITNADLTSHANLVGTYTCTIPDDDPNANDSYFSYQDTTRLIPLLPCEADAADTSPETMEIRRERDNLRQRIMDGEPCQLIVSEAQALQQARET